MELILNYDFYAAITFNCVPVIIAIFQNATYGQCAVDKRSYVQNFVAARLCDT